MDDISDVAVIGAGTMGAQIATLCALSGKNVVLWDAYQPALDAGMQRVQEVILPALISTRKLDQNESAATADQLRSAPSIESAVADAQLVIEAVREDLEVKQELFGTLSALTPAILATNSSSIPSSAIAPAVQQPERLLNMHFFAPIWIRAMLELMSCGATSDETMERAYAFGNSLGLVTAVVNGESKGFIINRIWRAVKRESLRVVDEGVASPEDVDRLWMMFFQTTQAPFGIMDMVGLDVVSDIETSYQNVTLDPTDTPSPTLKRMIAEGTLGEKSGSGFYQHPNPHYLDEDFLTSKG